MTFSVLELAQLKTFYIMCEDFDTVWGGCQQTIRKLAEKTEAVRESAPSDKLISGQEYMQTYQYIHC